MACETSSCWTRFETTLLAIVVVVVVVIEMKKAIVVVRPLTKSPALNSAPAQSDRMDTQSERSGKLRWPCCACQRYE